MMNISDLSKSSIAFISCVFMQICDSVSTLKYKEGLSDSYFYRAYITIKIMYN